MIVPVILSGGSGTRLWPLSRKMHPKQLLPLLNKTTLLQDTVNRFGRATDIDHVVVICNESYRFMVAEQVRETKIKGVDIILEPVGRNTAPAIALAAFNAIQDEQDPTLLILPADHDIKDIDGFLDAIKLGQSQSDSDNLVTFGIVPDMPETGYGYINAGDSIADNCFSVAGFVEKPDRATAESYIEQGSYYWNSGMFMFKASTYLAALERLRPDMFEACQNAYNKSERDMDFIRIDEATFENCPSDSIDYAVMEKVDNAVVIPVDIGWSDVGSWAALHDIGDVDAMNNTIMGDVEAEASNNCYIRSESRLVVALGVSDLVIVDTADALLVAHREQVQGIKNIVEKLHNDGRDEVMLHKSVCRPWGCYQGIDSSDRFQAKRITVKPGAVLSLQLHHHRAEHWVVVNGTAKVTKGDDVFILSENESTYIPLGVKHRLENIGKIPLELIEVQTGSYLGEDDIVRFDDVYGRHGA
ncbi:MAG: mannose-1-phosphate guanylyltransferase/mannose-6-phosphate isomerase [Gammaproteobacteria bacterium]|nr:mannose-1-phosphate guanylyltransferase/mannose-6-phosphate isomerase [Gammaproteobacteria bacterium]